MTAPIQLSAETARRFVLGKQGTWPDRRWHGRGGAREAIRAMEHLQLDPVVIVARSHDLVLHSRVSAYRPEFFDELVHRERAFFDWGGWLAVRPMEELPYWRTFMRRNREHGRVKEMGETYAAAIESMRARLRAGELIASREVESSGAGALRTYRGSKEGSLALYYLWRTGEAMTYERRGFERVYAAAERVAPPELLVEADGHESELFVMRKAVAAGGIGRATQVSLWFMRNVSRPELEGLENELLDRGELTRVEVEAWRGRQFVATRDLPRLEAVAGGGIPEPLGESDAPSCTFLSPLDPLVARGRARTIFGFDHTWEIYKRPADVRYGRYTMPILFGDRLVGRVDLRTDRSRAALVVNGLWFEADAPSAAELRGPLAAEVGRLMEFLRVTSLDTEALPAARAGLLTPPAP